ncbi:MAG: hypothetical protein ACP5P1_13710, partial [Acidimicrobiales bacterium]
MGFQHTSAIKATKSRLHLGSQRPALEVARVETLRGGRLEGYEAGGFLGAWVTNRCDSRSRRWGARLGPWTA